MFITIFLGETSFLSQRKIRLLTEVSEMITHVKHKKTFFADFWRSKQVHSEEYQYVLECRRKKALQEQYLNRLSGSFIAMHLSELFKIDQKRQENLH